MFEYRKTEDGIMEIRASGKITRDDIDAIWAQMTADFPAAGKVRLLEVVGDLRGMEPAALFEDLKLGLPMLDRFERVAVVTHSALIEAASRIGNVFLSADVRTFEPDAIDAARAWLKSA